MSGLAHDPRAATPDATTPDAMTPDVLTPHVPTMAYPRPALLGRLPTSGYGVIEASAGTGKTFTLEHLVVELLLRDPTLRMEHILVVTFTERATSELKSRVRQLLQRIVHATRGLVEQGAQAPPEPLAHDSCWRISAADRARLERALFSFDVAPIYTIHGFCQRVLTEFAFAQQRAMDQRHVELPALFERAFTDALRRTLSRDERTRDWLEAWLEVSSMEELRELLMRALISEAELWPRYMGDELRELLDELGPTFWQTYRELYSRAAAGRERAFLSAQREFVRTGSVARFLMEADAEVLDLKHSLQTVQPQTPRQERFVRLVTRLLRFKPAIAQHLAPFVQEALEREKRRGGLYTYDDMLSLVWQSLRGPDGAWLTQALRRRYRWALIDEFQDTDPTQWDIFRHLFFHDQQRDGMVVIGDPKQAIYGFRGADVQTYLRACAQLAQADALGPAPQAADPQVAEPQDPPRHTPADHSPDHSPDHSSEGQADRQAPSAPAARFAKLHLMENFRSTGALIDAYNAILDQRAQKPLFQGPEIRYDHPVRCGQPALTLEDAQGQPLRPVVLGALKRRDQDQKTDLSTDDLYECYGRWIAFEIQKLLSDQGHVRFGPAGQTRRLGARDITILTRSSADEAKLERYLREANIPYALFKHEGLFQTPQASELYTLLKAIDDPHDRSKRLKAWETPFFGLRMEQLAACREVREADPLYKTLLDWNQLARQQRFEALFHEILQRSGIVRREIFEGGKERELTNVLHLMEVLLEEAHLGRLDFSELVVRTRAFIEQRRKPLGEEGNVKRLESDRDAVQILTMHKSKGLEAPIIFLYPFGGTAGEYWPFTYERDGQHVRALHIHKPEGKISPRLRERVERCARQEDERLLYVALTRAMARLYVPYVPYAGGVPICKKLPERAYIVLNDRLRDMLPSLHEPPLSSLFELDEIPYFGINLAGPPADPRALELAQSWEPPVEHLQSASMLRDDPALERLRPPSRRLESYSSLKRKEGGYTTFAPVHEDELRVEAELGAPLEGAAQEGDLPGGVRTGQCLHDLLERLDYATLTRYPDDLELWSQDPEVRQLCEQSLILHGLELEHLALCQRVVYRALTATVEVEHGVIYGLGLAAQRSLRELEFTYPLPQDDHPLLDQRRGGPLPVERGFIKGFIDYVFEWGQRVYFVDWKSDILERYDGPTLHQHFEANYRLQVMLYTLALCKIMGLHDEASYQARFGGAIYCFLRGMRDDSHQGLVRLRPSWAELLEAELALRQSARAAEAALTPQVHDP